MSRDPQTFKVAFAVTEAGPEVAVGDYFTALELGSALRKLLRWDVVWLPEPQWYEVGDANAVIAMTDHYDPSRLGARAAGLIKICWMRNWFDRWAGRPHFGMWDIRLCSSQRAADFILDNHGFACPVLHIAANPARFRPRPEEKLYDYVFTGSYWKAPRDIEHLDPAAIGLRFALYGKNWENHPRFKAYYKGFAPYHAMARVYNQSRMLVDDANSVTKAWASVNSRVFDALASGILVVTNGAAGSAEVFDNLLPVYDSPDTLRDILRRYLDDENLYRQTLEPLRERVLARHTYEIRARELAQILYGHLRTAATRPRETPARPAARVAAKTAVIFAAVGRSERAAACLAATLEHTPADCRVLVVGDAETVAGLAAILEKQPGRTTVVPAPPGQNHAQACNRGAAAADAVFLVFLADDVEPQPGWLELLLAAAEAAEAGAAGGQSHFPDGCVAHAGIAVAQRSGVAPLLAVRPFLGESPAVALPARTAAVQAVASEFMLVRAEDFRDAGGFDPDLGMDGQGADLCFKLASLGRTVIYEPASLAIRHAVPPARQPALAVDAGDARLQARWAGLVAPDILDDHDAVGPGPALSRPRPDTPTPAPEPGYGEALAHWWKRRRARSLPPRPARPGGVRVAVRVSPASPRRPDREDTAIGRELADALARLGHAALVEIGQPTGTQADIAVHIRGACRLYPRPGPVNVLWIVSHPELVTRAELDDFDLALCAGKPLLRQLAATTDTPCHHLPLAASAACLAVARPHEKRLDLLYVGDYGHEPPFGGNGIVRDALEAGCASLRVVGRGWAGKLPDGVLLQEDGPPEVLARLAAMARINLNGHGPAMARAGLVNRRAYDLAALGCFQISNPVPGLEALGVTTYPHPEGLSQAIAAYLSDEEARNRAAALSRERCEGETFEARARTILELAGW